GKDRPLVANAEVVRLEVLRLGELRELDARCGELGAGAVVIVRLVRLRTHALRQGCGVVGIGVGVPAFERAGADARRRVGARSLGLAQWNSLGCKEETRDQRKDAYARLPSNHLATP